MPPKSNTKKKPAETPPEKKPAETPPEKKPAEAPPEKPAEGGSAADLLSELTGDVRALKERLLPAEKPAETPEQKPADASESSGGWSALVVGLMVLLLPLGIAYRLYQLGTSQESQDS